MLDLTRPAARGLVSLLLLVPGCHHPPEDTRFPDTLGQSTAQGPADPSKPVVVSQDVPPPGPGMPISTRPPSAEPAPAPPPAPPPAPDGGSDTAPSTSGAPEQ